MVPKKPKGSLEAFPLVELLPLTTQLEVGTGLRFFKGKKMKGCEDQLLHQGWAQVSFGP